MDYILAGYVEKLADSCIRLAQNDENIATISKNTTEILVDLTERVRVLEKQSDTSYEVFVTSSQGYRFPVVMFDSKKKAYYWILGQFILLPSEIDYLARWDELPFLVHKPCRGYQVIKVEIKNTRKE